VFCDNYFPFALRLIPRKSSPGMEREEDRGKEVEVSTTREKLFPRLTLLQAHGAVKAVDVDVRPLCRAVNARQAPVIDGVP
jgi:hypothetical protein